MILDDVKTLCGLFQEQARRKPEAVFLRARFRHGLPCETFQEITWSGAQAQVRRMAQGLIALGLSEGDRVSIFSHNRPRWILSDQAIQAAGGAGVPIYPTSTNRQLEYILNDSKSRMIIVGEDSLLKQTLDVRDNCPGLEWIIALSPSSGPAPKGVISYDDLLKMGDDSDRPDEYEKRLAAVTPDTIAAIIYTSGTTGDPKGAVLSQDNFMANVRQIMDTTLNRKILEKGESFNCLCHLPLCHVYGRTSDYHAQMAMGGEITFAESYEKMPQNLLEVRPQLICSIPRLYEKTYEAVNMAVTRMTPLQQRMFRWAKGVGDRMVQAMSTGKRMPLLVALQMPIATRLVFDRIRKLAGMDRLVMANSGGGAISAEVVRFFRAMNIQMSEGYGLTETSPVLTWNSPELLGGMPRGRIPALCLEWMLQTMIQAQKNGVSPFTRPILALKLTIAYNLLLYRMILKPGTVGQPLKDTEIKIAEDGEILAKGPQVFSREKGYFNRPDLTASAFTEDGWFLTGDIGHFDEHGFLVITDRKKELLVTAGGKNIAPHPIELELELDPFIEQACVVGDAKKYIAALIVPNFQQLETDLLLKGIEFSDRKALISHPETIALFQERIGKINQNLARYEQIKKFRLLENPFSEETGELTPTLKLKRRVIYNKYGNIIESMY
jgi:long-chain acyl-CoA synthetase